MLVEAAVVKYLDPRSSYVILEMREQSGYADSAESYEFPDKYLRVIEGALLHGEVIALIYEPRREEGRQAFVGWARICRPPVPSGKPGLQKIYFESGMRSFDVIVPFASSGSPAEHRLRSIPRKGWGQALQGRSIRPISEQNAVEILTLGSSRYATAYDPQASTVEDGQRVRYLVSKLERDSIFRDEVLSAYRFKCAVTGLGVGPNPASRLFGALDAAHIQPVSKNGPDDRRNGIAMSPTVHRLFDAGLFTLFPRDSDLVIRCSPHLQANMLTSENGTRIVIHEGARVALPTAVDRHPARTYLEFHRSHIFRSI